MELKGKKVAIFGLGDQIRYPETLPMVLACWRKFFEGDGATLVGFTSSEGYTSNVPEPYEVISGADW